MKITGFVKMYRLNHPIAFYEFNSMHMGKWPMELWPVYLETSTNLPYKIVTVAVQNNSADVETRIEICLSS